MDDVGLAMAEMSRVVGPGRPVAGYVWDFAGEMEVLRRFWDAAIAMDPAAAEADHGARFALCQPEPLRALFDGADLTETEVRAIDVTAKFPDFDTYWTALTTGNGSTIRYARALVPATRAAIRARLKDTLPRPGQAFRLNARAWAARGTTRAD